MESGRKRRRRSVGWILRTKRKGRGEWNHKEREDPLPIMKTWFQGPKVDLLGSSFLWGDVK